MNMNAGTIAGLCLWLAGTLSAGAATVALVPSAANVQPGDAFTVDLTLDATDAPGSHPGLFSGRVVIDFDAALVDFGSFSFNPPAESFLATDWTEGTAGNGNMTVSLAFQQMTDTGVIGSFSFDVIGDAGSSIVIGVADAGLLPPSFVNELPSNQRFTPVFNGTTVQIVPLPGALWCLLGALGLGGAIKRRAARAAA